ncbi:hypothetical protein ACFXKR_40675 [Streptomyces violascens]|uniref:hypothetical protein n=1 Tax=Streptomyces violascens TaxID=67381 RepID=UPI0036A2BA22
MHVETAGAGATADDGVLPLGRASVSLDGVPTPAQVPGDGAQAHALVQQALDQGMMRAHTLGPGPGWQHVPHRISLNHAADLQHGTFLARRKDDGAQLVPVGCDALLDCLTNVLP